MPVTLEVNTHSSNPIERNLLNETQTPTHALFKTSPESSKIFRHLLHSSLPATVVRAFVPTGNGFVHACMKAYNDHHHLHIRPDDVWITILTQFSSYVNAHAEELRSWFVPHEGKKELSITVPGCRFGADYGWMAERFAGMMEKELVPGHGLQDWILPRFSTTTKTDTSVEAGLMMCVLKAYFEFSVCFLCGLPSVTLLGTKEDWVILRRRIDKFLEFGEEQKELKEWHGLLAPVLDRFVDMFTAISEEKDKQRMRDFWNVMCKRESMGSGSPMITGWLCYFCPFTAEGKWQLAPASTKPYKIFRQLAAASTVKPEPPNEYKTFSEIVAGKGNFCAWQASLDTSSIPVVTSQVGININDNGVLVDGILVTGMVGYEVIGEKQDTLKPLPGWWMFEVDKDKKANEDQKLKEREQQEEKWRQTREEYRL